MTLKAQIESLEEVPEPLREHYAPLAEGEGFRLTVEKAGGLALVSEDGALKATREARQEAKEAARAAQEARARAAAFEGLEPDQVREALDRLEKLEKGKPKGDQDTEAAFRERLAKELDPIRKKHQDELKAESTASELLRQTLVSTEIRRVLAQKEFDGSFSLLSTPMSGRLRPEVGERGVALRVLDADGEPWTKVHPDTGAVVDATIEDLARELMNDREFAPAFGARSKAPHGANGSGPAGRSTTNPYKSGNLTEQMELERTDPSAAKRLAAEAGV